LRVYKETGDLKKVVQHVVQETRAGITAAQQQARGAL